MRSRIRARAASRLGVPLCLLVVVGWLGSCAWATGPHCRYVTRWSKRLTFGIASVPTGSDADKPGLRHTVLIRLTEPPGIEMWRFRSRLRDLHCAEISRGEADTWVANAEILAGEHARTGSPSATAQTLDELISVGYRGRGASVAVTDLSPQGLEAARELSCLAWKALREPASLAIREVAPSFSDSIDFPATCATGRSE